MASRSHRAVRGRTKRDVVGRQPHAALCLRRREAGMGRIAGQAVRRGLGGRQWIATVTVARREADVLGTLSRGRRRLAKARFVVRSTGLERRRHRRQRLLPPSKFVVGVVVPGGGGRQARHWIGHSSRRRALHLCLCNRSAEQAEAAMGTFVQDIRRVTYDGARGFP